MKIQMSISVDKDLSRRIRAAAKKEKLKISTFLNQILSTAIGKPTK